MNHEHWKRQIAWMGFAAALSAFSAFGASYTWTGNVGNDWFVPGNWDVDGNVPATPPGTDDAVFIAEGSVLLTNETAELTAFTMTGGALAFSNWTTRLRAGTITVSAGTVTLPEAFTETDMPNRVWFVASGNFTLGADAIIDADGRGFRNLNGLGKGVSYQSIHWRQGSGAGHAGRGGRASSVVLQGAMYGSVVEPVDPGSGCGGIEEGGFGFGGGAVRIEAGGTATIDGTITVSGWPGTGGSNRAGGGSGGSVLIECATFAGAATGLIKANGGNSSGTHSGGGSGGRIAVHYAALTDPCAVRFSAIGGINGWADNTTGALPEHFHYLASWGSLYFPDTQVLETGFADDRFLADVHIGTAATWNRTALQVVDTVLRLASPDLRLDLSGNLDVGTDGTFHFHGANLTVGGHATLAGGSDTALFSGANLTGTNYGQRVEINGTLQVQDGATLWVHSDPVSGGSPLIRAGEITVAAGGLISARARGYGGDTGEGAGTQQPTPRTGAGYGGTGGAVNFVHQRRGYSYGSTDQPLLPGSGGSSGATRARAVGGGGLIRLEATDIVMDGVLDADGGGVLAGGGAGSGGAIHITCNRLGGDGGILSVRGGQGSGQYQGGGGGGRIALHYGELLNPHRLAFRADPGKGWPDEDPKNRGWIGAAQPGTLFLPDTALLDAEMTDGRFSGIRIFFPEHVQSWSIPGDLTVGDTHFYIESTNFSLNVGGSLTVETAGLVGLGEFGVLTVQGDLVLTNGGALRLDAGGEPTTADGWGVLAQINGAMTVAPDSWVYLHSHPVLGGSPLLRLGGLYVATNAGFNADARGYEHGKGPGAGKRNWTGINVEGMGSGGGHGGRGGDTRYLWKASDPGIGGATNGVAWMPIRGGSGGYKGTGGHLALLTAFPAYPGTGGGAIRLDIDGPTRIDGTLTAEGFSGIITARIAGGAGGAVFIRCSQRFLLGASDALISVNGGHGGAGVQRSSGGGGGGRVAVWMNAPTATWQAIADGSFSRYLVKDEIPAPFQGSVSLAPGDGYDGWDPNDTGDPAAVGADEGTLVVLRVLPPPGTLITIR